VEENILAAVTRSVLPGCLSSPTPNMPLSEIDPEPELAVLATSHKIGICFMDARAP
jgi:hypothetical protein